jgi:hypothetical protein
VVTATNAEDVRLGALPAVQGLVIGSAQGPHVSRSESWFNGRRTRTVEQTFLVVIEPQATGEYTLPPLEVSVDGRVRATPELDLTVVEDLEGAELGLFELGASSTRVVEGQPFTVEIVFGFDAGLGQRVNYVNLSLPWWNQLSGTIELEPEEPPSNAFEFTLNSRERVRVERIEDRTLRGRPFVVFRLRRSLLPTRTGTLAFPTSTVEFGEVEDVRDFFRTERRKVETWFVRAPELSVEVVPLPEAGRPLDFGGALGRITAEAQAEPRDVDAGDSIKLSVEWTGSGNLEFFEPPDLERLEAFRAFRVYGRTDEHKSLDRRRVTYDVAPLSSEITEIPSVPLSAFDPELGRYYTVETRPLAVRVRPLENEVNLTAETRDERFERDVRDIAARPGAPPRPGPGGAAVGALLAAGPGLWLGLRLARGRRDPDAPLERRRRRARRELARALARAAGPREELDALNAFLAARTREPEQAWLGRDPRAALPEGVSPEALRELAGLVAELERGAYGGAADGGRVGRGRVLGVADRLIGSGL